MSLLNRESPAPVPASLGQRPGKVLLFSSGETAAGAHKIFARLFSALPPPIRVAVLETPAGFELNSTAVAQRVADYISLSLTNFSPTIDVIPARRNDGPFSTNDAELLAPLLAANFLYLGAGSPTYAVRHLCGSLTLRYIVGRHRSGADLCFASASAIAFGAKCLPVYEIYKAGSDLHWVDGLDFFGPFGFELTIVSHWNNHEGGPSLDTSHCFMGRSRMEQLRSMLPATTVMLGIDEHTALELDFQSESGYVLGKGGVTILRPGQMEYFASGETIPFPRLGPYHPVALEPEPVLSAFGRQMAGPTEAHDSTILPEALDLARQREAARKAGEWAKADELRRRLTQLGYEVRDTEHGTKLVPVGGQGQK